MRSRLWQVNTPCDMLFPLLIASFPIYSNSHLCSLVRAAWLLSSHFREYLWPDKNARACRRSIATESRNRERTVEASTRFRTTNSDLAVIDLEKVYLSKRKCLRTRCVYRKRERKRESRRKVEKHRRQRAYNLVWDSSRKSCDLQSCSRRHHRVRSRR